MLAMLNETFSVIFKQCALAMIFFCTIFQGHQFVTHRKDNQQEKWTYFHVLQQCTVKLCVSYLKQNRTLATRAAIYYAGNSLDF